MVNYHTILLTGQSAVIVVIQSKTLSKFIKLLLGDFYGMNHENAVRIQIPIPTLHLCSHKTEIKCNNGFPLPSMSLSNVRIQQVSWIVNPLYEVKKKNCYTFFLSLTLKYYMVQFLYTKIIIKKIEDYTATFIGN